MTKGFAVDCVTPRRFYEVGGFIPVRDGMRATMCGQNPNQGRIGALKVPSFLSGDGLLDLGAVALPEGQTRLGAGQRSFRSHARDWRSPHGRPVYKYGIWLKINH
ncbi:hypothetical protein DNA98_05285 [Meiothermus sp. Pnk-1]|nr:hypothetical protein DNA98_05285 [Meiothermus sp. Pnk-1]